MKDKNMSPLRYYTMMQTQKLSKKFNTENLIVDFAMRYGSPSINGKIKDLEDFKTFGKILIEWAPGNTPHLKINDGSIVSGMITKFDKDTISLKTEFAGTIKIERDKVLSVDSKEDFSIKLKGGKKALGSLTRDAKKINIVEDKDKKVVGFSEVLSISPKVEKPLERKWSLTTLWTTGSCAERGRTCSFFKEE